MTSPPSPPDSEPHLDPGAQETFARSGHWAVQIHRDKHPDTPITDAVIAELWHEYFLDLFQEPGPISEETKDAARGAFVAGAREACGGE